MRASLRMGGQRALRLLARALRRSEPCRRRTSPASGEALRRNPRPRAPHRRGRVERQTCQARGVSRSRATWRRRYAPKLREVGHHGDENDRGELPVSLCLQCHVVHDACKRWSAACNAPALPLRSSGKWTAILVVGSRTTTAAATSVALCAGWLGWSWQSLACGLTRVCRKSWPGVRPAVLRTLGDPCALGSMRNCSDRSRKRRVSKNGV